MNLAPPRSLLLVLALSPATFAADGWESFVERAGAEQGAFGQRCAEFLAANRPPHDADLDAEFLLENLRLALAARAEFPWAAALPEERFLNDVLPYASLDETREPWRAEFLEIARAMVLGCKSATDAAQALNRQFFDHFGVHYDTGRKAPNQSPMESKAQGRATCTGLSIILVDACRAVGVPARVAGTALWSNKRGNHTWVEVWDGEWRYTGADEYDAKGLNRGWFTGDASKAVADDWRHAIWATSWRRTGAHFPMVWNLECEDVPGVNVTERYTETGSEDAGRAPAASVTATVNLRVFERPGGERIAVRAALLDAEGVVLQSVVTKAGTADMNDMSQLLLEPKREYTLRLRQGADERSVSISSDGGEETRDLVWSALESGSTALRMVGAWLSLLPEERHLSIPKVPLTAIEADAVVTMVAESRLAEIRLTRAEEHEAHTVVAGDRTMRYLTRTFGDAPDDGRSLWISMHGGGGAPTRVNDQQWQNQISLYEPDEGIVVAPRAPTDTWNLWHEAHIDDQFDRLIESFVACEGVDPDRVYLMGYSAGGDGVYQLAPRMADRFAAASMMAGHPNDASPLGLRNLPFRIFMGGNDTAYKRNEVAAQWGEKLAALAADDPGGYVHEVTIYDGLGHWMERRDREALPWMAAHTRDPWPRKLVWRQSGRTHDRFYWLAVKRGSAKGGEVVRAEVDGQTIALSIAGDDRRAVTLRLHDALVDLDHPITVTANGAVVFEGTVPRSVETIHRSLQQRADPRTTATATLDVEW